MKKFIILFTAMVIPLALNAQLASYNFNSDTTDQVGGYDATPIGSPTYVNGEYVSLDSTDYFRLPDTLQSAIEIDSSLEIRVRFKVEGNYKATPGEDARIIVSSKNTYFQPQGGFDVAAREWEEQLQIITTFGDGIDYEPGGCVTCCSSCRQSEGKLDFVSNIEPGIWYDFSMKFIFDKGVPYIQYTVNNTVSISYYDERVDYDVFRHTLNQQQISVGADSANKILTLGFPSLKLDIDYLTIASPILPGNQNKVSDALQTLTDDINGNITLTNAEVDSLRGVFVNNWDDASFSANKQVVLSYVSAYAAHFGPIFDQIYQENPADFPPKESIQYNIEQWILDNMYGPSTVKEMEGLIFKDHEIFPGTVSAAAPRLTGATFTIDGDYQTDPGFVLNGQEYARRTTGYYVPPGELVTITAPMSAVNKGLTIYVGAHSKNVQETWSEFSRFPRISTRYQIDTNVITVTNPFGGGIYITVPDSKHLGPLEFRVDGAVKAPYYCTKKGFSNSLADFKSDLANKYVPWIDMESSNFMCTISAGEANLMTDPDSILSIWDRTFDAYNIALGRPLKRFRGEYIIVDRQPHVKYTFAPADYPMALVSNTNPYFDDLVLPVAVQEGRDWYKSQSAYHFIVCHEFGHLHNMPTLTMEQEANVNMPAAAVYNLVMGETIDSAFVYSIQQRLNLDQAALDWILTPNFYKGNHIGWDTLEYRVTGSQQMYQSRGFAKLVDIANLFGWEALGNIMGYFYDYKLSHPEWSPYTLGDDEFIEAASLKMGFNMAPHFEFWGIIPSDSLVQKLDTMPTSDVIKKRILRFRTLVPRDNAAIQPVCNLMISKLESQHDVRYEAMKMNYDEATANKIIARIDTILAKYYVLDSADFDQQPVITGMSASLSNDRDVPITLSLNDFLVNDPDNIYPDDFTLNLYDGNNYTFSGNEVIPDPGFVGMLGVPVTVNDGMSESEQYLAAIEVIQTADITGSSVIEHFRLYPNPVSDVLVLETDHTVKTYDIAIYSLNGDKVFSKVMSTKNKQTFHLTNLAGGIYIVHIKSGEEAGNFKLIKY